LKRRDRARVLRRGLLLPVALSVLVFASVPLATKGRRQDGRTVGFGPGKAVVARAQDSRGAGAPLRMPVPKPSTRKKHFQVASAEYKGILGFFLDMQGTNPIWTPADPGIRGRRRLLVLASDAFALRASTDQGRSPSDRDLMAALQHALARGQQAEASFILKKLLEHPDVSADTLLQTGVLFAQQDLYADAARAFARCAKDYPALFEGHYNLALADFALQKYIEALAALELPRNASPPQEIARQYLRGKVEAALGMSRAAQSDLEAVFAKAPREQNYALDLGLFYLRQARYANAAEVFARGTQANPSSAYLWLGLSVALFQGRAYARSIEACRHVLALEPDFSPAWLMQAFVLALQGKLEEAEKAAAQGLTLPNPHPYLYYFHVSLLLKQQSTDYDRQLRELAHAEHGIPDCSLCGLAKSKIHQAQGNLGVAIADLERTVKLDPNFSEAWYRLALLYERAGRAQDAERARARHSRLKMQESDREAETLRQVFTRSLGGVESSGSPR
jgi:tetratricopeptide (TPR) repeat protein